MIDDMETTDKPYRIVTENIYDDEDGTYYGELEKYLPRIRHGAAVEILVKGKWESGYFYDEISENNGRHWVSNTPNIETSFTVDRDDVKLK